MKSNLILVIVAFCLFGCTNTRKAPSVSEGKIIAYTSFISEHIDDRNVDIWLPESYTQGKDHPVLYMHDGQMLFDASQTWNGQAWNVHEVLTNLENDIQPLPIVVGIWNNAAARHANFVPQKVVDNYATPKLDSILRFTMSGEQKLFTEKPNADAYLKFLVEELKPHIDATFNTKSDVANSFIAGSSMGGLISLYALLEYPEVFGGAACLSTHWPVVFYVEDNPFPETIASYLSDNSQALRGKKLYLDRGTKTLDSLYELGQNSIDSIIDAAKIDGLIWKSEIFDGAEHTENDWNKRLDIPLRFLFE